MRLLKGPWPRGATKRESHLENQTSKILVIDAGRSGTRILVVSVDDARTRVIVAAEDEAIIQRFQTGCILSDWVGQERAIDNLSSLLSVVEKSDFCVIGMPPLSIEKNAHIAEHVKPVVNGPVEVVADHVGAGWLADKCEGILLNAGVSGWSSVSVFDLCGAVEYLKGGRTGQFTTVGGGDWIGQELYRKACELQDVGNKSESYFFRSIAHCWVIDSQVVTSEEIKGLLETYDEMEKRRDELENEMKRNPKGSPETKNIGSAIMYVHMRYERFEQYLESYRDAIVEYAEHSQYVDWSSLVPLCEAIALDNNSGEAGKIARRILENAGEGLAGLVEAAIRISDDDGPVIRELIWFGGVLNVPIVRDTCFRRLYNIRNLRIDKQASDPIFGLIRLAQYRMSQKVS